VIGLATHLLGPPVHHLHPVCQAQRPDRSLQKRRSPGAGVEKDPVPFWPGEGQDQAGHPSPASQIHTPTGGKAVEGENKRPGVVDVIKDGSGSEKAEVPSLTEELQ
jgi:hypothetical protein